MFKQITNSEELEITSDQFIGFSDSFVDRFEFISGMSLTTDNSISVANENSEIIITLRLQLVSKVILLWFKDIIVFNYEFGNYDNILNDNELIFRGARFHFKTDYFLIKSKNLDYKIKW